MDSFLKSKKVIVCAGSGGVGKTTMSAALSVRAAEIGLKVLVLTVDPAQRLATALGLKSMDDTDVFVPGQTYPGQLYAAKVNAKTTFDQFVRATAPDKETVDKLFANPLYDRLSTTLGGSQEFTALERLYQALQNKKYDLVILDTPPAAHAMDFLDSTQKLEALFEDSVLRWFMIPFDKKSRFTKLFNRGSKIALKAFEILAGSAFLNDLGDLFTHIYAMRDPLLTRFREIRTVLRGKDTAFILVTGFDVDKIDEARRFRDELSRREVSLTHIIVNRAFPRWFASHSEEARLDGDPRAVELLKDYFGRLSRFYSRHQQAFDAFEKQVGGRVRFVRVVDFDSEVYDLKSLEIVAEELVRASAVKGVS